MQGNEQFDFLGLDDLKVGDNPVTMLIRGARGQSQPVELAVRIDSLQEIRYLINGGVLPYVIRKVVQRTRQ
ncbi:Aconitate hydratase [compost metagenome]